MKSDSEPEETPQKTRESPPSPPPYRRCPDGPLVCAAARTSCVEIMKYLLTHGVSPNTRDWGNKTSLMHAARHGHLEMVTLLLNAGVYVNAYGLYQPCALSLAAELGHTDIVRILLAHPHVDPDPCSRFHRERGPRGESPLIHAIEGHYVEIVRMLLEKRVNPRINNNSNKSPLSIAVAKGNLTIIQLLLEKGADPNAYYWADDASILVAVKNMHVEDLWPLLERGVDLDIKQETGQTPLDVAKLYGNMEIIEYLKD